MNSLDTSAVFFYSAYFSNSPSNYQLQTLKRKSKRFLFLSFKKDKNTDKVRKKMTEKTEPKILTSFSINDILGSSHCSGEETNVSEEGMLLNVDLDQYLINKMATKTNIVIVVYRSGNYSKVFYF